MAAELIPALVATAQKEGLLKQLYTDAAQPGMQQVGKALSTVLGLGNTVLLPLQLLNDRAEATAKAWSEQYRARMQQIPPDEVVAIAPEVGVPIVEKLGYVEDVDLRQLYINLLVKGSTVNTVAQAHPSFVNVINNMCPDEAILLKQFKKRATIPFVNVRLASKGKFRTLAPLHFRYEPENVPTHLSNSAAYVSNLEGLGLLKVNQMEWLADESHYADIKAHAEENFAQVASLGEGWTLDCAKGRIDLTAFGKLFLSACLDDSTTMSGEK